ncbi:MAG TPA: hypothetical protein VJU58_13680 [Microbacterium sp.]|nr:hypothetical protein [Microbacterium sp.]
MTDRPLDPEILADLRLRDRTARERADRRGPDGLDVGQDPDGLSPALAALYDSRPDPEVESWPCRGRCGRMVGVTRVAIERLAKSNRMLASKRERPIGKHEVMWCPDCKRADDEARAAARRPHEQRELQLARGSR